MRELLRGDFDSILILPSRAEIFFCHLQRAASAGEGKHPLLSPPVDTAGTVPSEVNRSTPHYVSGVCDEPNAFLFSLERLPRFRQIACKISGESSRRLFDRSEMMDIPDATLYQEAVLVPLEKRRAAYQI